MDIQNGVKLLLEADKIEAINFPTETHREFIVFISQQCKKSAITALLKGSMAKGNAQEYSDIDIILTGENISNCLDLIIGSFDKILLSEHFAATSPYGQLTCSFHACFSAGVFSIQSSRICDSSSHFAISKSFVLA